MKRVIVIILFLGILAGGLFLGKAASGKKVPVVSSPLQKITQQMPSSSQGQVAGDKTANTTSFAPTRLQIPAISVDAAVESVGMDSQGRMDIPKTDFDVAWYNLGYKPGQVGNAVIDGHLDRVSGAPAVFWNLAKLTPGDSIIVSDDNGHQLTFSVTQTVNYPWNQFPLQQVFGSASQPQLNLITCQGTWDSASHNYSDRTVVYSVLKSS